MASAPRGRLQQAGSAASRPGSSSSSKAPGKHTASSSQQQQQRHHHHQHHQLVEKRDSQGEPPTSAQLNTRARQYDLAQFWSTRPSSSSAAAPTDPRNPAPAALPHTFTCEPYLQRDASSRPENQPNDMTKGTGQLLTNTMLTSPLGLPADRRGIPPLSTAPSFSSSSLYMLASTASLESIAGTVDDVVDEGQQQHNESDAGEVFGNGGHHHNTHPNPFQTTSSSSHPVAHASPWSSSHAPTHKKPPRKPLGGPSSRSQHGPILMGSLVSCCHVLRDESGKKGLFFVFPDVGVRAGGVFRLRFRLFDVGRRVIGGTNPPTVPTPAPAASDASTPARASRPVSTASSSQRPSTGTTSQDRASVESVSRVEEREEGAGGRPAQATVFTDVFTVFTPKAFPGMMGSTPLSKARRYHHHRRWGSKKKHRIDID
ncbi:velvet factor-domain-containing protein [Fimicolochytrium jonesii]|uniref:velvet factor-domain-containing protein n=1 Tax=Fimicolochytrium jonesii TaxID=1396493 RepID=UPI0022FEF887|nr:velvet factor-domain-containing protein [Fimicolochytrium jonesii]KAI8820099.1 velvet factor-domain-containing protein [Fimicolochytrium jonesii]